MMNQIVPFDSKMSIAFFLDCFAARKIRKATKHIKKKKTTAAATRYHISHTVSFKHDILQY